MAGGQRTRGQEGPEVKGVRRQCFGWAQDTTGGRKGAEDTTVGGDVYGAEVTALRSIRHYSGGRGDVKGAKGTALGGYRTILWGAKDTTGWGVM